MIRTIGSASKECITIKSMLKSNRLLNYFIKTNLANLMATPIKHGSSYMSLLLINLAGQSGKELSLNGVSITNSTALSTLSMISSPQLAQN